MGFLDKLGLQRKKKAYVPFTVEKQKKDKAPGLFNKNNIFKFLLSIGFLALVIGLYPKSTVQDTSYNVGEPWRDDDLTAPFTFSLIKDDSEIREEIRDIQQNTPPIFIVDHDAEIRAFSRIEDIIREMNPVLEAFSDWQESKMMESEQARDDSLYFVQMRNRSELNLGAEHWQPFLDRYLENGERPDELPVHKQVQDRLNNLLGELYSDGVIDISKDEIQTDEITLRDMRERTEQTVSLDLIRTISDARAFTETRLTRRFEQDLVQSALVLFDTILKPNLSFSEQHTENLIQEKIEAISPTKGAVSAGQVIIRHGDIITPERHNMLQSLARARAERASDIELWKQYFGESLLVIAVFLVFFFYIYLYRRKIFDENPMFLLVFLIIAMVYTIGALVARVDELSPYVVPFAIAPILMTIIFDSRVGLMTTTMIALLAGLMFGANFEFVLATITACSIGVYSVRDIKDRSQFYLTTPALIFFSYALVLLGFTLTKVGGWSIYTDNLLFLLGNIVGIWLAYPLILLIEKTFRITTDVTLLELSDTNQPILKQLMLEAPGTFHHSLQVANLAEAAATGIGANSLLCRVGALYHDIGKLEKPQYFAENQSSGNVHDKLKPRMSALIIKNHVDAGVKMAGEIELPEKIIDFIRTHHGTSLIRFFYEKALNESGNDQEIQEEDFRYEGPIPGSKETGILLLADGVEAASRAMSDHSFQKLGNLVTRMVDDRLAEGQLNNCALTLRDLKIIKDIFTRILQGMYHGRVKYPAQPGKTSGEETGHASAEDSPSKSQHKSG